ncbi:putative Endonuclease III like protein [Blattamonas nauphoetae]|uniref:Endonuclease III homolog n=1 Tax=Blattamonas nauphoetae TaxID=2049346 RepID=A0ABQ9XZ68_9EUKA|nr:putative Endonuclease III like protein [Blattamonas nauphoetae]
MSQRKSPKKSVKHVPPNDWQDVWDGIVEMRKSKNAPVDLIGASSSADRNAPPKVQRFQYLVGLMLSSLTKDANTNQAIQNLRSVGLTVDKMRELTEDEIDTHIKGVGFHKTKAKNIKKVADILHEKYDDDTPPTYEEVILLPGVGPKMGHLFIQLSTGQAQGIGVDVHVHRIANRLKWANSTTPEGTRVQLESWLPHDKWMEINELVVGFGQTQCPAQNPKCDTCLISKICPSSALGKQKRTRSSKTEKKKPKRAVKSRKRAKDSSSDDPSDDYESNFLDSDDDRVVAEDSEPDDEND